MTMYTIIMEWDSGTYIWQAHGQTVPQAINRWVEQLDVALIPGMGPKAKIQLAAEIADEKAVPIRGVTNVWCYCPSPLGKLALVNVVRTDPEVSE